MDLLVLAKEPRPGQVKTRLCPPCTPEQAASIAAAALADTFEAALDSGADRVVAVLDGRPGDWLPPGVVVRAQGAGSFNDRLRHAWGTTAGPTLQIGMDTPQVGADALTEACEAVVRFGAALGLALDGGWWALGLATPRTDLFDGIPPSTPETGRLQLNRLWALGLDVASLPVMRDIDTWADALAVAEQARGSRVAAAVRL